MNVSKAAANMLILLDKHFDNPVEGERREDGRGVNHAAFLLAEVASGSVHGEKAHRWLGWAQCVLTYEGVVDLDACKYANVFS